MQGKHTELHGEGPPLPDLIPSKSNNVLPNVIKNYPFLPVTPSPV